MVNKLTITAVNVQNIDQNTGDNIVDRNSLTNKESSVIISI